MAEDVRTALDTTGMESFEKQFKKPHCVVLDSAYCSMGRMIGVRACRMSGYEYYDAVILLELVPECGVSADDLAAYEEKTKARIWTKEEMQADPEYQKLKKVFDLAIDRALAKGPCLIHDRAGKDEILARGYTCISAMTYAEKPEYLIERAKVSPLYKDLTDGALILEKIREEDNNRKSWHNASSDIPWGPKENYDLVINSDEFGRDYSAVLLAMTMKDPQ